ncbi:MAG: DUF2157 domain-containing protein [Bacteroidetes bacterium]|nr:MAG: DUF2157 domain-containing protein [Bacteroidota bacterium]
MRNQLLKYLQELVQAQVISDQTAEDIQQYFARKQQASPNRSMMVFGILGALFVGLGILLILAHNWDHFSRATKTVIAFVPLLAGQLACGWTLLKHPQSASWREGSSTFLFLAIGSCISLISQIYNISGSMSSFVLCWMLLGLPLVYVMRSGMSSLFFLTGVTFYGWEVGYNFSGGHAPWLYLLLLALALPFYIQLLRKRPNSNFTYFHHWLLALSVVIVLGSFSGSQDHWMFVAYFALFALLYLYGQTAFFEQAKMVYNAPRLLGSLGSVVLMFIFSFYDMWKDVLGDQEWLFPLQRDVWIALLLSLAAAGLYFWLRRRAAENWEPNPMSWMLFFFIPTFVLGHFLPVVATIVMNLAIFLLGIYEIREGARDRELGTLNFGLLLISALIVCRFFDTDISFVLRGILFVLIGAGFFVANYRMLKAKKSSNPSTEQQHDPQ